MQVVVGQAQWIQLQAVAAATRVGSLGRHKRVVELHISGCWLPLISISLLCACNVVGVLVSHPGSLVFHHPPTDPVREGRNPGALQVARNRCWSLQLSTPARLSFPRTPQNAAARSRAQLGGRGGSHQWYCVTIRGPCSGAGLEDGSCHPGPKVQQGLLLWLCAGQSSVVRGHADVSQGLTCQGQGIALS